MKFSELTAESRRRWAGLPRRAPLRTVTELAQEFGLTLAQMRGRLRAADAPKPVMVRRSQTAGQNTWYAPEEVRAWWKKTTEKKEG